MIAEATGIPADRIVLQSQRNNFQELAFCGIQVSKCISYRDRRVCNAEGKLALLTLFIDGRALGIKVCSRLFSQPRLSPDEVAQAVQARPPASLRLMIHGGAPCEQMPEAQIFRDRDSIVLYVVTPIPAARLPADSPDTDTLTGGPRARQRL